MRRDRPLSGPGSQYMHVPEHFTFPRTSGLTRYDFASDRPPFPWRPLLVLALLIAIGLFVTRGIESDEAISFRLHQVQR